MAVKYLWDTNKVIYFLPKQFPHPAEKFVVDLTKDAKPAISFVTEIELLCWKSTDQKSLDIINSFISDCDVIELDQSIKLKTVDIRKTYRTKLPDAIIAATAIVNGMTLITGNVSDFSIVSGLKIINPWDI